MKRTPLQRKTPMKRMSKRRRKELRTYSEKRLAFLEANPICQVCLARPATQVHHTKRRGRFYLDESTWLAVCAFNGQRMGCHEWIERNPSLAREMGYLGSIHT